MTDLFNNSSNDYIHPGLSPCAGINDDSYLEFLPNGEVGIITGSDINAKIDFSNLRIPVSSWNQHLKILYPGEVTYIPGLSKGLCKRFQKFNIPNLSSNNTSQNNLFLQIDLSINYYNNFRFTYSNIDTSSNYDQNLDIEAALNLAFSQKAIKVNATYDPSYLGFRGNQDGYEFSISNVLLTLIDASQNNNSPFNPIIIDGERADITYNLEEDSSASIPFAKYPNGANQGVVLSNTYPKNTDSGSEIVPSNKWIYINHVSDMITYYREIQIDNFISDVSKYLSVSFDPSTSLVCDISEPSINLDFSVKDISILYDVSVVNFSIEDANIIPTDASIDSSLNTFNGDDISYLNIFDAIIIDSSVYFSNIFDSSIETSHLEDSYIMSKYIDDSSVISSGIVNTNINGSDIWDSQLENIDSSESTFNNSLLFESNVYHSIVNDSSIKNSLIAEVSTLYAIPSSPLDYYSFNGTIGTADPSPASWVQNYTQGYDGSALILDGSGFIIPGFINPLSMTVGFWFKAGNNPNPQVIFDISNVGFTDRFRFLVDSTGILSYNIIGGGSAINNISNINDNNFHYILVTYDQGTGNWNFYVDDVENPVDTIISGPQPNFSSTTINSIGSSYDGTDIVEGVIDEFRIYDSVLSLNDRKAIKYGGNYEFLNSVINNSYSINSLLRRTNIFSSYILDSSIWDSSINGSNLGYSNIWNSQISDSDLLGYSISLNSLIDSSLFDSSIESFKLNNVDLYSSYVRDCSAINIDGSLNEIEQSIIWDSELTHSDILDTSIYNLLSNNNYFNESHLRDSSLYDSSVNNSVVRTSLVENSYIQDSSIYDSYNYSIYTDNIVIGQSDVSSSILKETMIGETNIWDSSILGGSIINNISTVNNSFIVNSWTNTYRLLVYEDPSTGQKTYDYIMNDQTLDIDSSLERINIENSNVWDSSINNALLEDTSLYRCYIEDSSIVNCILYNCIIDASLYVSLSDNNRIVLVDPSIMNKIELTYDSSLFYEKITKRLDVGLNGESTNLIMSAGDYLDLINEKNEWNKIGDLYINSSAPDDSDCKNRNLLDGFYLYNPHEFPVKVDYLIYTNNK